MPMSVETTKPGVNRRHFISSALAAAAAGVLAAPSKARGAVTHQPLDPVNPDILFGTTSSIWGKQHDLVWAVKRIAALGLQGIEPYGDAIEKYRKNPIEPKRIFDEAGIPCIDACKVEIVRRDNLI